HPNIKVIPNFIPEIPLEVSNLDNNNVLSVGRMDYGDQKGFLRLIDIWKIVVDSKDFNPKWNLTIVGDGILKEKIESKIKELNLNSYITLKPFTKEIHKEYLNSSIYVMSSFFEGLPMVLVESGSYGIPLISFDINTGPSDIIEHNKSGYLIKDNDLIDFANKIIILMNDKNKRKEFGLKQREIIQDKFNKDSIMKLWEELFYNE
ncbi:glycosyltransferase, partial [Helicobacter sp. MIT 14-3879]|uniref:glycosyltransferase n=1 Tax=Helicobacter sp. MIT 14-3879 TaxID=2040649 RepID=UPI000E362181